MTANRHHAATPSPMSASDRLKLARNYPAHVRPVSPWTFAVVIVAGLVLAVAL